MFRFGFDAGKLDYGLGQGFDQRDIPIWVVLARERSRADDGIFVELGQAEAGSVRVRAVAERGEDVLVLLTREAVCVGNGRVDGGAQVPT